MQNRHPWISRLGSHPPLSQLILSALYQVLLLPVSCSCRECPVNMCVFKC